MNKDFGLGHQLNMPRYYTDPKRKEAMAKRRIVKNQDFDSLTIDHTKVNSIRTFISESAKKSPIGVLRKEEAKALVKKIKEIASNFVGIKEMSQNERAEIIKTSCKYFSNNPHKIKSIDSIIRPVFSDLDNQIQNKENQIPQPLLSLRSTLLRAVNLKNAQHRVRFQPPETELNPDEPLNPDSKHLQQPRL